MRFQLLSFFLLPILASAAVDEQVPLGGSANMSETYSPLMNTQPALADLLTIEPSASIFYSYARELELSAEFADVNTQRTLLVPTNKAVMALARKPHQGPEPDNEGVIITEEEFDAQSKKNVERWISAHIIPQSPISLTEGTYATLLEGHSVDLKEIEGKPDSPEWTRVVLNGVIHIVAAKKAVNGVLYMIDDTVKF